MIEEQEKEKVPYKQVLEDMEIFDHESQKDFTDTCLLTAENCYGICASNGDKLLSGKFDWSCAGKSYEMFFTYFHSDDLLFRIDGFEL